MKAKKSWPIRIHARGVMKLIQDMNLNGTLIYRCVNCWGLFSSKEEAYNPKHKCFASRECNGDFIHRGPYSAAKRQAVPQKPRSRNKPL